MNKNHLGIIVRVMLTLGLLLVLFTVVINGEERQQFLHQIGQMNTGLYLAGLIVFFLFIILWAVRWGFILRAAGEHSRLPNLILTILVGNFFALFLPEAVGSDLARATRGMQGQTNANYVSTVLLDRVVGLVSLVLMAGIALLVGNQVITNQTAVYVIGGTALFFVVGWVLFFSRRLMEWVFSWLFKLPILSRWQVSLRNLYEALYQLHNQPRLLVSALLLSMFVQLTEISSVVLLGRALGIETAPAYYFVVVPIVWLLITIPISIGGLGVREGVFIAFFSQVGVAEPEALAVSLLYYSFKVVTGLLGGMVFLAQSLGFLSSHSTLES